MEECCALRHFLCAPRVEKLQRKLQRSLVMSRCMKRRSSFWRSRERMWVFFCAYCSSSLSHRGKSLCLVSYVDCHLLRFLPILPGTGGEQAVGHSVELHEVTVWTEGTVMTLQLLWRVWEDIAVYSTSIETSSENSCLIPLKNMLFSNKFNVWSFFKRLISID